MATPSKPIRFNHRLEHLLVRAMLLVCRILPESLLRGLGKLGASLYYALGRRRRVTTLANLELAFPNKSAAEREQIARAAYQHFVAVLLDNVLIMTGRRSRESFAEKADMSALDKLRGQAATGRGLICITGHLGQWELMSQLAESALGRQMTVVTRHLSNPLLEQRLILPFRTATGVQVIYKDKAMLSAAKLLKRGGMLGLLMDQKANKLIGAKATFLGRRVLCLASSAQLQLRLDTDCRAAFMLRDPDGSLKLLVSDPIVPDDPKADDALDALLQKHQDAISQAIEAHPEQWFWMHDRFSLGDKTKRRARARKRAAQAAADS